MICRTYVLDSYANQVYTGVGGDKFGIHWSFEDVSVVCQRSKLEVRTSVPVFATAKYEFASTYDDSVTTMEATETTQFSD